MTIFRNFFVLILFWSIHCFAVDATDLIEAIERRDSAAVIDFFDQIDVIDLEEARDLISNVYGYYVVQFGSEILNSEEYLKNLDYCKELYHSILEQHGFSLENSLIHNENKDSYEILLCGKKNKEKKGLEVPGSMVLGGVEMLVLCKLNFCTFGCSESSRGCDAAKGGSIPSPIQPPLAASQPRGFDAAESTKI